MGSICCTYLLIYCMFMCSDTVYPSLIFFCGSFILILFFLCLTQSRSVTPSLFFTVLSQVGHPSPKTLLTSIKSMHEYSWVHSYRSAVQKQFAHWSFLFYLSVFICVCVCVCVFSISRLSSCCPYVAVRERCVSICWVNAWVRPSATCSHYSAFFMQPLH